MYSTSRIEIEAMTAEGALTAESAGVSFESLKSTTRDHASEIGDCYADAFTQSPKLRGELRVRVGINPDGSVRAALTTLNTTGIDELGCCVAERVLSWSFKPTATTKLVVAELPILAFHPPR